VWRSGCLHGAANGLSVATICRRLAAIGYMHRGAGGTVIAV
jgi:hypothetical protein